MYWITRARLTAVYRECSMSGFKINRDAENLIKMNMVMAMLTLLVGVIAAILLVLTRWQVVHLLPADWYYRLLTAHGLNMLIFFIMFFEMALMYFGSSVLLKCRVPTPIVGWFAYVAMITGVVLVEYTVFTGQADVLFTSYVPLRAHPLYYLGITLFAVGALLVTSLFFATLIVARREKTYEGSVPLFTFGIMTGAIISVITLLHGAAIYLPTLLWSVNIVNVDPQIYRLIWWAMGHASQQINVAMMVAVWYLLGAFTCGAMVINEKISRVAFVLYILFISMASAHHLLVDPGMGPEWKVWNTSYAMYLAVLASMIHGFTVPAGIEYGQRLRGFVQGKFEWLRKAPWSDPGFSGLFLSLIIFGFMGGITGVTLGTEQINIIAHNTMRIPGHFHVTVVGGTALAFMALTYYMLPIFFRKRVVCWGLAKIQPYIFAIGIVIFSISLTFMGSLGVPRRHWDITFSGAPFAVDFHPAVGMFSASMALGGIIAAIGVLSYLWITMATIFAGESLEEEDVKNLQSSSADTKTFWGIPSGMVKLPVQSHNAEAVAVVENAGGARGTMVLVGIFLVCFVLYYFTNWKLLSTVWKVG